MMESAPPPAAAADPSAARGPADGTRHSLSPAWVRCRRLTNTVWLLLLTGALTAGVLLLLSTATTLPRVLLYGTWVMVVVAAAAVAFLWPAVAWRHASYRLDEQGLEVRHGVLWRSIIDVRRTRIQHSDVSQGPLERRFGLGTLRLHTAGTRHARIQLRGLPHERALQMREFLMQTVSEDVV